MKSGLHRRLPNTLNSVRMGANVVAKPFNQLNADDAHKQLTNTLRQLISWIEDGAAFHKINKEWREHLSLAGREYLPSAIAALEIAERANSQNAIELEAKDLDCLLRLAFCAGEFRTHVFNSEKPRTRMGTERWLKIRNVIEQIDQDEDLRGQSAIARNRAICQSALNIDPL